MRAARGGVGETGGVEKRDAAIMPVLFRACFSARAYRLAQRLGIAAPEAWLARIEPRVVDAWQALAFARVEPEAFGMGDSAVGEAVSGLASNGQPIRRMDPAVGSAVRTTNQTRLVRTADPTGIPAASTRTLTAQNTIARIRPREALIQISWRV